MSTGLRVLLVLYLFAGSEASDSPVPCRFPEQCDCSLRDDETVLTCLAMQNCFSQAGMDAIGASIDPNSCPLRKVVLSCNQRSSIHPIIEFTSDLFRHEQWRRIKELSIGPFCSFVFNQVRVFSKLPKLSAFALRSSNMSMDLEQFSDIFCCPVGLTEILIQGMAAEVKERRFGPRSLLRLTALKLFTVVFSPKLFDRIDLVLNTSSLSFAFRWHGSLPKVNGNFSSLSFNNLGTKSALELLFSDSGTQKFSLDGPARLKGFDLYKLQFHSTRLVSIGPTPFQNLTLKDVSVTGAGLDEKLLPKLLSAISHVREPLQMRTLALEFNYKKQGFPFEEFNALCRSLPLLRRLSLSHSRISFSDADRYFDCPQLFLLSMTNCKLSNEDLPPHAFSRLTQLSNLRLIHNTLSEFPKELLINQSQITYLDLSYNPIRLGATDLRGILPGLETLKLINIWYYEPLVNAFVDQPNLTALYLNNLVDVQKLKTPCPIGRTWFRNCSKLRVLSLSHNNFLNKKECHGHQFFDPLTGIQELDLTGCNFGSQSDGMVKALLAKLPTLTMLHLANNAMTRIEFFLSRKFPSLNFLDVQGNKFSSIPVNLLVSQTPRLQELRLMQVPLASVDPLTFSRIANIRIRLGRNQFACNCELLPFANWIRQQWPLYKLESKADWLLDANCYNTSIRVIDFRLSWWDCYNRRLIVLLSSSIGCLIVLFSLISLIVRYRWKLRYTLLAFCIRYGLLIRKVPTEWVYDACFIYDESDNAVTEWVQALVLKLESDLQLRLYEAERDAPVGANILDEAASAIDKSRHAVLVLSRGFLENRLNMYSAQWSSESLFMRRRSLAVLLMREKLSESDLRLAESQVLHRLYRMCKPDRIVDCSGCGVGANSANRLGLLLYSGAGRKEEAPRETSETEPLIDDN